jgi:nuclear transport factor 2 (NTF2) superfamily protein
MTEPIKPQFNEETARAKVKAAQDAWNTRNPEHVAQACSNSRWRNRTEFFTGRQAIIEFLKRKWAKETRLSSDEGTLVLYRKSHFCQI